MRFGIILLWSGRPESCIRQARLAEDVGFDWIGVGDVPSLFHDVFVTLSLVAQHTSKVRLGPLVTNPLVRHPVVAAGAAAAIEAIAPRRTFFGIGSGFAGVRDLGLKPASLDPLRQYVCTLRDLLSGREAVWQGQALHLRQAVGEVPIVISAHGPKSLALAAEVGDGVIIHNGLTPSLVSSAVEAIGPSRDVWALAKANVGDDRERAIDEIKAGLAASGYHGFGTYAGKDVPAELVPRIETLKRRYVVAEHQQPGRTPNVALVDELGLAEFLAERFAVVGTPEDCREKLRSIQRAGISQVVFTGVAPDPERLIRRLGEDVIAHLRS